MDHAGRRRLWGGRPVVLVLLVLQVLQLWAGHGVEGQAGAGHRSRRHHKGDEAEAPRRGRQAEGPRPSSCGEARCEDRVVFVIQDAAQPGRPLAGFTYRVRVGEQEIAGTCPAGKGAAPLGRCAEGGLVLPLTPEQLDVSIEADGYRPLLQSLTPAYRSIPAAPAAPGCRDTCRQAEIRLSLQKEQA